jgi:signal transduction histidine kinase
MEQQPRARFEWMDLLWLIFLGGLALLEPIREPHKQMILLAIGIYQIIEGRIVALLPRHGRPYSVVIKILLATLLIDHTGQIGINSSYYPIYYLPVVTAATYFGPWGTLLWTTLASLAYCSFLLPALEQYQLTASGFTELAIRILFFYIAAILVNRFVVDSRRQALEQQRLTETLTETNRQLEHAQAEARRSERLAALGQLSAGLAHEIRNPLGVIKGSAEMLAKKMQASNPLASELAGNISSEVNRVNGLVSRFLDFARPSKLELRAEDVAEILERALKAVREQKPEAGVNVEREFASALPRVMLDAGLCEQMFINLAQNAYESMAGKGGTLRVKLAPAQENGRAGVAIEMQDTGPGVPAELREQIFNPFVTTKAAGVGLGLSIVSKIVDDHRGSIRVTSEPGRGACFRVFFPAEGNP